MAYNTIKVKKYSDIIEEKEAYEALYPGHLLEFHSDGTVKKHSGAGECVVPIMFALENELVGGSIDDAFADGDLVQVWVPGRGDEVYAVLADGETAVIGSLLESNGDGTLAVHSASSAGAVEYPNSVVGVALEALDLSGSSGEESSETLGYDKRILIKVA